jgi:DNA-binding NtrC family response regulator
MIEMEKKHSILIVEDDISLRNSIKNILKRREYEVSEANSVKTAILTLKMRVFDLILLDITLKDGSGMDVLKKISNDYKNRVIIISGTGTIDIAVEAIKMGAFAFLQKPAGRDVILETVKKNILLNQKLDDYQALISELGDKSKFEDIIFKSLQMKKIIQKAIKITDLDNTILISGETGTGKELLTRAIHNTSKRKNEPLITINSASIPDTLAESELFGFEAGAFTDATSSFPGKFILAGNGTIFLDEISELSPLIQSKLLRVLESGEISPLKSAKTKKINARIITATNKNLEILVKKGLFRKDLFYRVNQINIHIPPLRKRKTDIIPIAEHFLFISNIALSKRIERFDDEVKETLLQYSWPGNIRELKNVINEISLFVSGPEIKMKHLPYSILMQKNSFKKEEHLSTLKEIERNQIIKVLKSTNFNIKKSAKILGISRPSIYKKIKEFNINKI